MFYRAWGIPVAGERPISPSLGCVGRHDNDLYHPRIAASNLFAGAPFLFSFSGAFFTDAGDAPVFGGTTTGVPGLQQIYNVSAHLQRALGRNTRGTHLEVRFLLSNDRGTVLNLALGSTNPFVPASVPSLRSLLFRSASSISAWHAASIFAGLLR
ncbi:hypothetical protein C8R44DRAFT_883463 [Mycena epipterygia]|nr:hypothetical protein C8R44DRAFT_883463 [Mycena epipterygia]